MKRAVLLTLSCLLASPLLAADKPVPPGKAPVARVGGQVITADELAAEAKPGVTAAETRFAEQVWEARSAALQALVEKRLLEATARKEALTVDALLEREVTAKVAAPTDEEIAGVYERTKAAGTPVGPLADVRGEIFAFLKGQRLQEVRQAYLARLKGETPVQTMLPPYLPPKVEVRAEGPVRGSGPVTIVEFADYECGYCAAAEPTLRKLLADYPGKVRLVMQDFPLPIHASAPKASEAALCAGEQGKYWEMHDLLYDNQSALGVDRLKEYARRAGLDATAFDACLDSGRKAAVVDAVRRNATELRVEATPTFYVNGRPLVGSQPYEKFQGIVDYELGPRSP